MVSARKRALVFVGLVGGKGLEGMACCVDERMLITETSGEEKVTEE